MLWMDFYAYLQNQNAGPATAGFLSAVGRYLRFGAGAALGSLQGTFGSGDVKAACAGGEAFLSVDCRTVVPHAERHRGLSGIVEKSKKAYSRTHTFLLYAF